MAACLSKAIGLIEALEGARTSQAMGRALLDALASFGARSLFAGSFPILPRARAEEIVAGRHLLAQISPAGWLDNYYRRGLDAGNPVIFGPARRATAFRWSAPGFADLANWRGLALARDSGVDDGLAVPCHGPGRRVAVVSIGFERFELGPDEVTAIALAATVAQHRMSELNPSGSDLPDKPALTARERDCLAFVAEGLSDAEIAERLGISSTTAHGYVENAKRKLGARSRAQAVARLFTSGLL